MGKSTGAPRHLNQEQEEELVNIIVTRTPDEFGYIARKNWDTTILRKLVLQLFGVSFYWIIHVFTMQSCLRPS